MQFFSYPTFVLSLPWVWRGVLGLLLMLAAFPGGVLGQSAPPTIDPKMFEFSLPSGTVKQASGERVTTLDDEGQSVIAKVHVQVGENFIVMLPDGKLVARKASETASSEQPFKAIAKEALITRLTNGRFKGFKSKSTRHFVFIYNTSDEFALVTFRVLESMVPGVMQYMETNKLKVRDPEVPLVVLMFKTEEEFQAYNRMPAGVVAYYTPATNQVVLYEESRLARVRQELAVQQAISTIAHEGAHQILHNIGIQQRLSVWPMWISEGLAEYFAPTSTGKKLNWKGSGQVNDMRMFELEQYLKGRDADAADGHLIEQTIVGARLTSTGYATAWSITHFLAKQQRVEFHKYVGELSKLGPLEGDLRIQTPGIIPTNRPLFTQYFGSDAAAIEKKLINHLKKLPYNDPFADFPHFVTLVSVGTGSRAKRDANLFHSSEMAEKWRNESIEKMAPEQRNSAQSTIRSFPNRASAEVFARQWLQGK